MLKKVIEKTGVKADMEERPDPLDVAQWCADAKGRREVLRIVRDELSRVQEPGRLHQALARLPAPVMVTTSYDRLMEKALAQEQGVPPDVIVEDRHIALIDEARRTTLIKMHGCLSLPETIVLARDNNYARAEWLLRQCVFLPGAEVAPDGVDRDSVFGRLNHEQLQRRPTDAMEFAYVVTRRVEELREARHFDEAFEVVTEARYVLGDVLGIARKPEHKLGYFDEWERLEEPWSRFRTSRSRRFAREETSAVARAYALNHFGKCYRLSCALVLDRGRTNYRHYLERAEKYLRKASECDRLLPYPYAHRLELCSDKRLPSLERHWILDSVRTDLAPLEGDPVAELMLKSLRARFPVLERRG